MKNKIINILIFVIIPLLIGGMIYLLTRSDSLVMFDWLKKFELLEKITVIRSEFNIKNLLQNWIIYNFPAWIWTFSLTVLLGIIWNCKINKESLMVLLIPSLLSILSEIFQKINLLNGTFDYADLFFYLVGGISGLLAIISINTNHKFKFL